MSRPTLKAHRLLKHEKRATWDTGAAFFAHLTQELPQVCLALDWTALGAFRVLEACLIVEGRGIPLYSQGYPDLSLLGLRCQETRGSQCFCRKSRFARPCKHLQLNRDNLYCFSLDAKKKITPLQTAGIDTVSGRC